MPVVTMPDGTQVQMPDNPDPALLARLQAFQQSSAAKSAPQPSFLDKVLHTLGGVGDAGVAMASSAIAKPVSDLSGLGAIANNALGLQNVDPAQAQQQMRAALTYQPRTQEGSQILQGVGNFADKTLGAASRFFGQSGADDAKVLGLPQSVQDAARNGGAEFANQVPTLLGTKLPAAGQGAVDSAAQQAVAAAPRQAALQAAHDAGYVIPPAEMISAPVGKGLTGIAGKDQINRGFSLANQKVTNNIAAKDLSVPPDVPFDQAAVAKVKANANAVYEAARKADQTQIPQKSANGVTLTGPDGAPLTKPAGPVTMDAQYANDVKNIGASRANVDFGTPIDGVVQDLKDTLNKQSVSTDGLISKINELRENARTNLNTIDDTAKKSLGTAQQQAADALEGQLGRYLQSTGQPGMATALQQARTTLAKAKTVEDAMGADGNVDAAAINAYRNNGGYVGGGLKTIADAADSLGNVVRNTSKVSPPEPFSKMQFLFGVGGGGNLGGMLGGHAGAASGAAAGTLLGAPAAARAIVGSQAYQRMLGGQAPQASVFSRLAANQASPLAGLAVSSQENN